MITSIALFSTVALTAATVTITGLQYSAGIVAQVAASAPVRTDNLRQGYAPRPAVIRADDLNAARSVPVRPTPYPPPPEAAIAPAPGFTHSVTVEALRVRSGPKKTEPQVFTLKGGSFVNISDNVRGWVRITDETGQSGWVYGSLLRPRETAEAQLR